MAANLPYKVSGRDKADCGYLSDNIVFTHVAFTKSNTDGERN